MEKNIDADVIVIGGGLSGLTNALHLSKAGLNVLLLEKNEYPHHKVCGEYISNEILPYWQSLNIDPFSKGAVKIDRFVLSTPKGKTVHCPLPLGGFGISRYTLDAYLFEELTRYARIKKALVTSIEKQEKHFVVSTKSKDAFRAKLVIGAFGKRSNLDVHLERPFLQNKSPYLAVKCHYRGDFPEDLVALHNFKGGYCGVSKVENGLINICYLSHYESFKKYKNLNAFQEEVVMKNPHLAEVLSSSQMAWEKPISISQVSFAAKQQVEQGLFMSGDTAGMIHPLCGNGMAMAVHSAHLLSTLILQHFSRKNFDQGDLERDYINAWNKAFGKRLQFGGLFQFAFQRDNFFEKMIGGITYMPFLLPFFIRQTHGKTLEKAKLKFN